MKHPCVALDYLELLGFTVDSYRCLWEDDTDEYPILYLDLYTFFARAELFRIVLNDYIKDIKHLCIRDDNQGIEESRRMRTYSRLGRVYVDWVIMPWYWYINGFQYRVALRIFDTSAVHGCTNYANFCKNSGVELKYKDLFSLREKQNMLEPYLNRPIDYDDYALGDLYNHPALIGNAENFKKIYQSLDIEQYYTAPRLTIGSTVSRMIEAVVKKTLNVDSEDTYETKKYSSYACADNIKKLGSTGALNAKVDGGRCRNNRPTNTYAHGVLVDIDIAGCYGEGLRSQEYPLGTPLVIDYPLKSEQNEYLTLRAFRGKYGHDLVPGLWQARVSTKPGYTLKYKQDFLISWLPPKDITKMTTDSDFAETDEWWSIDNTGETRIYNNEIHNAIITHDFLQWLDNVASVQQRKEYMDELMIITAMYYPASNRVDSVQALKDAHANHQGKNTTEVKDRSNKKTKVKTEQECHAWYSVNLADLIISKLLLERKKHPKKTPFNELYKLCINTVYGDMVSPYFKIGNVVVGNNITARARSMAWYLEKGLNGWQSITDGCVFDLNRVVYPRESYRVHGCNTVDLHTQDSGDTKILFNSLVPGMVQVENHYLNYEPKTSALLSRLTITNDEGKQELFGYEALELVNTKSLEHLQNLFSGVDVLHKKTTDVYGKERIGQFEFEAKGIYNSATFHGTANYSLRWDIEDKIAMRSYSKHSHTVLDMNDDIEVIDEDGQPAKTFLTALREPLAIPRAKVYIKSKILKVGDYKRNYTKWMESPILPGMNIESAALLREFSLSQFTFQTHAQYTAWRKEYERLLRKYGQSYEMFFLNDDDTLNYQLMVETVYEAIRNGRFGLFDDLDKKAKHHYRKQIHHISEICLDAVSKELSERYVGGLPGHEGVMSDVYMGKSVD